MIKLSEARKSKLISWILSNQNKDGGFAFPHPLPSTPSATFYAVSSLKMLQVEVPNKNKTIKYLLNLQSANGKYYGIYTAYFFVKALSCFNLMPKNPAGVVKYILEYIGRWKRISKYYIQVASPLETICYSVEILTLLGYRKGLGEVPKLVLKFLSDDGGFGIRNNSEIITTYFALFTLHLIGYSLENPRKTINFIKRCQNPDYGFASTPRVYSHFIEDTYYGIKSLELFDEKIDKPEQTFKFVLKCQNEDGGFSRSVAGGCSTLENCFYAVHILDSLSKYKIGRIK
jgi:hypothetical protein